MPVNDSKRIFSWPQLLGVLVVCGLSLYLMLPDEPGLLEDLIEDGKTREARRVLEKISKEQRELEPLRFAVAEQRIQEADWDQDEAGAANYLLDSLQRWETLEFAPELSILWIDDFGPLSEITEVWAAITERWPRAPVSQQYFLIEPLVTNALQRERPDLAAQLYAQTFGPSPAQPDRALELARLHRLSGETQHAVTALEHAESDEVQRLRIALLRELNANQQALELILTEINQSKQPTREQIESLATIARSAGLPERALSAVRGYIEKAPNDLEMNRILVTLERESDHAVEAAETQGRVVELSDRDEAELREWGRLLEGSGQPNRAFDAWAELSLKRDPMALERLLALNPGLYRDEELANVLQEIVPIENHDDYTLQLAELLTGLGRYDEAVHAYELYFESAPYDAEAMVALAVLEIGLYRYDEAAKWLQRAKNTVDAGPDLRRKLAQAWTAMGEFEAAMVEYRDLAEMTGLADDYGSYFRLARGLGAYEDFVAGLEGAVASPEADVSNYLTLAYGYQLLGQEVKAKQTLREGMRRFPNNAEMPMRLAYSYSDAKRFKEAQEIVALHPKLGTDIEPTRLYLILMELNNDVSAQDRFIQRDFPDLVWRDDESKQSLARIHMRRGNLKLAEKLLREIHADAPENWGATGDLISVLIRRDKAKEAERILRPLLATNAPPAWRMAAEIASGLGQFGEAERYQSRYLEMINPPAATDWGALGDIRLSRGDIEGSKRAYRRALRQLQISLLNSPEVELP
ncbi:MAG: hypothetical protein SynsKO_20060 [Synoicihabitans sp.]